MKRSRSGPADFLHEGVGYPLELLRLVPAEARCPYTRTQKRVPESRPDWLETSIVSTPNGTTSQALVAADLAHVLWAVNMGCLGFHVWPSKASDPEHPTSCASTSTPARGSTSPC